MKQDTACSIAAIVVTYNRKELLRECIEALLAQTAKGLCILIIDNDSSDGTEDFIRDFIDSGRIGYYNTGKNMGGAGGFNYGMRIAAESGYNFMWLMDDDTIPMPDALEKLVDAAKKLDNEFGFLSGYAQFTDGTPCKMNIQDLQEERWIFNREFWEDGIIEIKKATFVSFFVPRSVVVQVGLPIKEFFIWADDSEYSKRISRRYPCYFVSSSVVVHKMSENIGADRDSFIHADQDRLQRHQYKYRNHFYIARQEGAKAVCHYLLNFVVTNMKVLRHGTYRFKKIRVLWSGFAKGLVFHPPIEYINDSQEKAS